MHQIQIILVIIVKIKLDMPLTKVLHRIQDQIRDILPALETFTDTSVQPAAEDCEQLQKLLCELQENLAVYRFTQREKEFSPSFMIHAKINEKELPAQAVNEVITPEPVRASEALPIPDDMAPPPAKPTTHTYKNLVFGINDKFRFINDLFAQNNSEYNIAFQQLNTLQNWDDSEVYLNSLKNLYEWKENNDTVKHLYSLVKKRFA